MTGTISVFSFIRPFAVDHHRLGNANVDVVNNAESFRQKFYKTMSDIKSEVEYVIKTGRQIVEKKLVDSPDKLNTQLDTIKQLYNELGAQVSERAEHGAHLSEFDDLRARMTDPDELCALLSELAELRLC